ncbi:MAG: hypothetical protein HY291_05620 [Planctomycetes bacterium]|nr:hypothetical protein [Planctomycetota bacterium]
MDKVFGKTYRAQAQPQPLWQRVVTTILLVGFLLLIGSWILATGHALWSWYRLIPAARQVLVGRLLAFTVGMIYLAFSCSAWNQLLFLSPHMRDLATTPGSPAQVLRVATRFYALSGDTLSLVIGILLVAPWFWREWITYFIDPAWAHLLPLCWPLAVLFAAGFCVLVRLMMDALAIGLNLAASALGIGGLGPRYSWIAFLYGNLRLGFLVAWLICASTVLGAAFIPDGVQNGPARAWLAFGGGILQALEDPGSTAHALFSNAPPVVAFNALIRLVNGPYEPAMCGMLGCVAWLAAGLAAIALCCRRGYSAEARMALNGFSADAKPADAAEAPERRFDPDAVSGPIEAWLLARFGRMARAALRLVTSNYEVGSVDAHLRRCLWAVPVCVIGGWLSALLLPEVVDALMQVFGSTLPPQGRRDLSQIAAATLVGGVLLYRVVVWGTFVNASAGNAQVLKASGVQADAANRVQVQSFRLAVPAPSRGDTRYPLCEIYAIGFSDAVLLPTFYTLLWTTVSVALAFAEALLLGLPAEVLVWIAVILIPALTQLVFLLSLLNIAGNCRDYRRSWVITAFKALAWTALWMAVFSGVISLVSWMVDASISNGRPWTGWLGAVNVAPVFDVTVYMLARTLYVRRRFDAERVEKNYG